MSSELVVLNKHRHELYRLQYGLHPQPRTAAQWRMAPTVGLHEDDRSDGKKNKNNNDMPSADTTANYVSVSSGRSCLRSMKLSSSLTGGSCSRGGRWLEVDNHMRLKCGIALAPETEKMATQVTHS